MSDNPHRAETRQALLKLGAEYGNLSDRKLTQWLDLLAHAESGAVERAVLRLMRDPERQFLPHIGEILAMIPRPAEAKHACWWGERLGQIEDCGCPWEDVPNERRRKIAEYALKSATRLYDPQARRQIDVELSPQNRSWIGRVCPEVIADHDERKQQALPAVAEAQV